MGQIQLLKVLCGSRAYGLETDDSDYDYHIVFAYPTRELLSIGSNTKSRQWIEGENDTTGWEVGHFLTLALNCNPTVLETFVAPVEESTSIGERVRALFPAVLSKRRVYEAFRGYAGNQRKKMFEHEGGTQSYDRELKFSVAYLRSLIHGTHLLERGTYEPKLNQVALSILRRVRDGKESRGFIVDFATEQEQYLTAAYLNSKLSDEPNLAEVNKALLRIRKELW